MEEDGYVGLFGRLGQGRAHPDFAGIILSSPGVIRNVGLINPHVTTTRWTVTSNSYAGALAGLVDNDSRIETSYVKGGRISTMTSAERAGASGHSHAGGLVGLLSMGSIANSYAGAEVATDLARDAG